MAELKRASFGSKMGAILAAAGSAVGLGNVWRFPYECGQDGGAAFIIVYIGCVLFLGVPVMMAEFMIGRHAQTNTARAFRKLSSGTPWGFIGYMGVFTGFMILGYYAVVSGWTLQYAWASMLGHFRGLTPAQYSQYFTDFSQDPIKPIIWLAVFLGLTHFVVVHGVRDGIERSSKLLMPLLFLILIILVVCSLMLPNAFAGVNFLFNPDFSKITSDAVLGALGQAFFSLSIGMGCLCTYASYFSKDTNLTNTAIQVSVIDTLVAIFAGLVIFPAAFSVGIKPDAGPPLVFITLPNVFDRAFANFPIIGYIFSLSFYILLAIAALTSTISLHEVATSFFHEELHITRKKAAGIVTVTCFVIGLFCSFSLGYMPGLKLFDRPLFNCLDDLTAQILLPFGGLCISLFVGWYLPHKLVRDEVSNWGTLRVRFFHLFIICVKYVCPIFITLIFLHGLKII
jgi:NSS family neurotransmitter:Na+ symporter